MIIYIYDADNSYHYFIYMMLIVFIYLIKCYAPIWNFLKILKYKLNRFNFIKSKDFIHSNFELTRIFKLNNKHFV
jgi:hypothetical protein